MATTEQSTTFEAPGHPDSPVQCKARYENFIGGEWVKPSSMSTIDVIDSTTEEIYFKVAEAQAKDVTRAVAAARTAFDEGPWPRMTHFERGEFLRGLAARLRGRGEDIGHDFIERVTFVIGKDHKVIATLSSAADKLSPDQHVEKALEIVQKLAAK